MKKALWFLCVLVLPAILGCTTPSRYISHIKLGMTPDQVRKIMGDPYTVRAAKTYEGGETAEIWEYIAPVFSAAAFSDKYDKSYWVFFQNGKVVQWGEPGDFSGTDSATGVMLVKDFYNKKLMR